MKPLTEKSIQIWVRCQWEIARRRLDVEILSWKVVNDKITFTLQDVFSDALSEKTFKHNDILQDRVNIDW